MKHRDVESTLEDLDWLDQSGVGAIEAAKRTEFASGEALEKWLERHGKYDLWLRFKQRDPVGIHHAPNRRQANAMTNTDTIAALLEDARQSSKKRTRSKAERVALMVDDLRTTLATEREQEARESEARKEIERLERQLAAARAKLKGGQAAATATAGPAASEIRAWAAANGVACPAMGRVPADVREAFEAAQESAA